MPVVLVLLPSGDFDPTEAGVPWQTLTRRGHTVCFATPDGHAAQAELEKVDALLLPGGHL